MSTDQNVPVIQADRELYLKLGIFHTCEDKMIHAGWADKGEEMQAIARHRLQQPIGGTAEEIWAAIDHLPGRGDLRDNDASRAALGRLAAALTPVPQESVCACHGNAPDGCIECNDTGVSPVPIEAPLSTLEERRADPTAALWRDMQIMAMPIEAGEVDGQAWIVDEIRRSIIRQVSADLVGAAEHHVRLSTTDWDIVLRHLKPTPSASSEVDNAERAEIEKAIKATEYKYFGDYEMSDDQREAVDQLVMTAQRYLALLPPTGNSPEVEAVLNLARKREYIVGGAGKATGNSRGESGT